MKARSKSTTKKAAKRVTSLRVRGRKGGAVRGGGRIAKKESGAENSTIQKI